MLLTRVDGVWGVVSLLAWRTRGRGPRLLFLSLPAAYLVLPRCRTPRTDPTGPRRVLAVAVLVMIIWLSLMPTPLPRQFGNERNRGRIGAALHIDTVLRKRSLEQQRSLQEL